MIFPTIDKISLILADEIIEPKTGGKLTIMGSYSGHIKAQRPPIGLGSDIQIVMGKLCLLWVIEDGEGNFDVRMSVQNPDGSINFETGSLPFTKKSDGALNVIIRAEPFMISSVVGTYKCTLFVNDRPYIKTFDLAWE